MHKTFSNLREKLMGYPKVIEPAFHPEEGTAFIFFNGSQHHHPVVGEASFFIEFPVDEIVFLKTEGGIHEIRDKELGLAHNESALKAWEGGLKVVQSKCLKVEHARLVK